MSGSRAWASIPKASASPAAPEKAAPIPASRKGRLTRKELAILKLIVSDHLASEHESGGKGVKMAEGILAKLDRSLADRVSQEERIREDEPLPERLRKSYEKGAEDERDRLLERFRHDREVNAYSIGLLVIEGAMPPIDRARLRGDAS